MNEEVQMIPIERIRVINPRHRDRKKFQVVIESIKTVGLKKPIQVRRRLAQEEVERWVLSFGGHADVVRPLGLRQRLAEIGREFVARYGEDGVRGS
jgi:ParB family chromosome partitioning protein